MISCASLYSSAPLRSWICPSRDLWRTLVWSSCTNHPQHLVCMWLQQRTWLAEYPLCPCFWLETQPQQSLICTASARILVSRWAALTQQGWTAGVAAMSMRLTRGCGNSDGASLAWVVCPLRRLKRGCKLQGMNGACVQLRLVGVARQIVHDWIEVWCWEVYQCIYCYILVYTRIYWVLFLVSSAWYKYVNFDFGQGNMLCHAWNRSIMVLEHHNTVPLCKQYNDDAWCQITVYTCIYIISPYVFGIYTVYTRIYKYILHILVYTRIYSYIPF